MAGRVKEDERNERIIRGLLKLPANKRCINCNNLGSQYVCTNFWTFVCTNCSGAHREFTHRVKSISMAKFTAQEVSALQDGGNERAREIFFKDWDPNRNAFPDSSNADKLRNFIKHVYVERRYTGERSFDRPPSRKDEYSENRRSDGNWAGSRSPPNGSYSDRRSYSGQSDDRNSRYPHGDRSPGHDQNDYKKSPGYFEVVDDRSGKVTPVQRFEDRRFSEPRKTDNGSPDYEKEPDGSSPVVRPVRDILGDNAPQLRIGEPSKPVAELPKPSIPRPIDPPKPNGARAIDPPPQAKTVSTAGSTASEGQSEQTKVASAVSLIDFSADPDPAAAAPQPAPVPPQHPVNAAAPQPVLEQAKNVPSVSAGDWASFDAFGQQQTPQAGSSSNPLESALAQLSFSETPSAPNVSAFPTSLDSTPKVNDRAQSPMIDQSHSFFDASFGISANQAPTVTSMHGSSVQGSLAAPIAVVPSQVTANQQGTGGIQGTPSSTDSRLSGRKELPADIFTALYQTAAPMPGWQRAPHFGMGYAMQYPTGMLQGMQAYPQGVFPRPAYQQPAYPQHAYPQPQHGYPQPQHAYPQPQHGYPQPQNAYPQPVKASNPFDLGNDPVPIQASLPLSGPLGTSTATATQGLPGTSNFGIPPQQSHQIYQSSAPPSHFMMQQAHSMPEQHNSMLPTHQGMGSFNMGFEQQVPPRYPQPSTPPSYSSVGGNPFG